MVIEKKQMDSCQICDLTNNQKPFCEFLSIDCVKRTPDYTAPFPQG